MNVSVRSYLIAGAAAATATTLALTAVQVTPDDVAVPAHPVAAEPQLSQAMVDLLAAASRMTAAVPIPSTPSGGGTAAVTGAAPSAAVTAAPGDVTVQNAASDFVDSAYQSIQYWVDYGVELADYVLGWIPYGYLIGDQVNIFYYNLIRPIADSVVYGFINPVLNAPLDIGSWVNGVVNVGTTALYSAINTGIAEANYFLGWILPPLPPLPLPLTTLAPAETSTLQTAIQTPVDSITDALVNANEGFFETVKAVTEGTVVNPAQSILNGVGLNLLANQVDFNYGLLRDLSQVEVDAISDLIKLPDSYLDKLEAGQNPLEALANQVDDASDTAGTRLRQAIKAVSDYADKQVGQFGGVTTLEQKAEAASVPTSVKASLKPEASTPADSTTKTETADTTETKDAPATKPARSAAKNLQDAVDKTVAKTAADAKKAGDDVRQAVKEATTGTSSTKTADRESKSESEKPAKKDRAEQKDSADKPKAKKEKSEKKSDN